MAKMRIVSKNKLDLNLKPRVYFTCHRDDFDPYFDQVCDDIFRTHDCVIWYTEDMAQAIAEEDRETDLGRYNLFVVPITAKLLTTPNRAMDEDIPYAVSKHIPILPIMMEPRLDAIYSRPDKFGALQYLNPYSTDKTEISYGDKLNKYLESVLISDDMARRVRTAFAAYIFLSYRKKDRQHANTLLRMIHSYPECRDVAVWFDEFLAPGESFQENIEKMLDDSKLFALLVTPQLLEKVIDENGEEHDNYVISTELPLAQKKREDKGTEILAIEMEETDHGAIPLLAGDDFVGSADHDLRQRLMGALPETVLAPSGDDPAHDFLIGLAYLDGIDVEVDRERAVKMITAAADSGEEEAIRKLIDMYGNADGVALSREKEIEWTQKLIECHQKQFAASGDMTTLMKLQSALFSYVHLLSMSGDTGASMDVAKEALVRFQGDMEAVLEKHGSTSPLEAAFYEELRYVWPAEVQGYMASILIADGCYDDAQQLLLEAIELLSAVRNTDHGFVKTIEEASHMRMRDAYGVLTELAQNYGYLGDIEFRQQRFETAYSYYAEQYDTIECCCRLYPEETECKLQLCSALKNKGWIKYTWKKDADGLRDIQQAERLLLDFFGDSESDREMAMLATCYQYMARIHLGEDRPGDACDNICKAIAINQSLVFEKDLKLYLHNYDRDRKVAQLIVQAMQIHAKVKTTELALLMKLWRLVDDPHLKNAIERILHDYYGLYKERADNSMNVDDLEKAEQCLHQCVGICAFFAEQSPTKANLEQLSDEYIKIAELMQTLGRRDEAIENYLAAQKVLVAPGALAGSSQSIKKAKQIRRKLFRLYLLKGNFKAALGLA